VLPIPCFADEPAAETRPAVSSLIHLDGPGVVSARSWSGFLEGRIFGGDEDLSYFGIGASLGLSRGWEGGVRAVFADRKLFPLAGGNAIDHGGNDVELLLRYGLMHGSMPLAGQIGISFADTPAQSDTFLTLGASAQHNLGSRAALVLNPRAVFIDGNTIVGIGLGGEVQVSPGVSLVADYTPIITGDNTRDTSTGNRKHRDIYGGALRFSSKDGHVALDLGYANGTGRTTGAGLTPGLGGSGAFYVSLRVSR
jgi:hypothetical protein